MYHLVGLGECLAQWIVGVGLVEKVACGMNRFPVLAKLVSESGQENEGKRDR